MDYKSSGIEETNELIRFLESRGLVFKRTSESDKPAAYRILYNDGRHADDLVDGEIRDFKENSGIGKLLKEFAIRLDRK